MGYTGVVNYDFLTLIQILAWGEEPTGVEFLDEEGIFIGKIYIKGGCLIGATFREYKGVEGFIQLVTSLNNTGGTFHKIPFSECSSEIAVPPGTRIDALLLSAIADKETAEGQEYQETDEQQENIDVNISHCRMTTTRVADVTQSAVNTMLREEWQEELLPMEQFCEESREIHDSFSLFNLESIMLYQEISGYLIVFTEKYWQNLFSEVDFNTLDDHGVQAHTCIMMADMVRKCLKRKSPSFDTSYLNSQELLEQVDMAISEASQEEKEVKIVPVTPEQTYDEELSIIEGFSETTLTEPSDRQEKIYQWLEDKLEQESAPLKFFFYPDKHARFTESKTSEPFRVVIAAMPDLCRKLCANMRYYLENCGRELVLYSIESLDEFQAIERSDWEDCHVTVIQQEFMGKNVYGTLSHIPEKMATVIIAKSRSSFRPYLGAPMFRERIQGIYGNNENEHAQLIIRLWELANI